MAKVPETGAIMVNMIDANRPRAGGHRTATLVFVSARWCQIAAPMRVIFEETLRDLASILPDVEVRGVEVDVDEAEAILADRADDATFEQPPTPPEPGTSGRPAASDEPGAIEIGEPSGDLDPLVTREFVESIDFVPMLVLLYHPTSPAPDSTPGSVAVELARFVGQLPKFHIRAGILEALDRHV